MDGFLQQLSDVWQKFATDPTQQTHALLGAILLAVGWIAFRRKKKTRINIDCNPGEKIFVQVGDDEPEPNPKLVEHEHTHHVNMSKDAK